MAEKELFKTVAYCGLVCGVCRNATPESRSRPTDPGDINPNTGEVYARTWYQWRLLEAFLRRAEMVSELIGLNNEDLDIKPSPALVAGNERSIREICEHVLGAQRWSMAGIEDGFSAYRKTKGDVSS